VDEMIRLLIALDAENPEVLPLLEGLILAGYAISLARDRERALEQAQAAPHHLIITDSGGDRGIPLLRAIQALFPSLPALLLTGEGVILLLTPREPNVPPACTVVSRTTSLAALQALVESICQRATRRC
jgi:DNA-binding NtrC family response regulator